MLTKRTLAAILLLAAVAATAQSPTAANPADIREYITSGWDTLSRSMSECKSVVDPKVQTTPVLYLPTDLPTPPAVAAMQANCHVEVDHLPRVIHRIGDVRPTELAVEGLLYLPNQIGRAHV